MALDDSSLQLNLVPRLLARPCLAACTLCCLLLPAAIDGRLLHTCLQEGGDHLSLSDIAKRAGKAQAAGHKPSERLRAIGLDPATWTMDPWKHMQQKEIPTRYDSQLEEYDDSLYDDGRPLEEQQEKPGSVLPGSRVGERSAIQQKGDGDDAGTTRSGLLAEITEQLIPGAREKGTLPLPGVGRNQHGGQQAGREAKAASRDQRDSSSLTSEGAQVDNKASGSWQTGLSSDSAAGEKNRKVARVTQGGQGSDPQRQAQPERRQGLTEEKLGTASSDRLARARDDADDGSASDEGERAGRRARHGQRPNASGDRAGAASAKRQHGSSETAMPAGDDEAEEGTGRTGRSAAHRKTGTATDKGTRVSRKGSSGVATYAADDDDDRDSADRDASSSTGQGVVGSTVDKSVRGSTKGAGQSQRSASEPEDGKNRRKAAPKVRPALKGYKLSWDVLEADQSSSTETLSNDPTRWSWTSSNSRQPGDAQALLKGGHACFAMTLIRQGHQHQNANTAGRLKTWCCCSMRPVCINALSACRPCNLHVYVNLPIHGRQHEACDSWHGCLTLPPACRPAGEPDSRAGPAQQQGPHSDHHMGQQRLPGLSSELGPPPHQPRCGQHPHWCAVFLCHIGVWET